MHKAAGDAAQPEPFAIREAEEHVIAYESIHALIEAIPAGTLVVDDEGRIRAANGDALELLRYHAEELEGQSVGNLLPERFRTGHGSLVRSYFGRPAKRAMGAGRALFARRSDGVELPIEISLNVINTTQGRFALATLVDVATRLRAENVFRQIAEAAPYGLLVVNSEGLIRMPNRQLCKILGYTEAELWGQPIELLLPERYRPQHPELRTGFQRAPTIREMGPGRDLTALHKDGGELPVEIGLSPISVEGKPAVLVTVTDITVRKRMELELRDINANLQEFTNVASHDLRSPLRGIADLLSWIKEDLVAAPEAVSKNLERASIRVHRMEQTIDNLLTYARAGRAATEFIAVDLRSIIAGIVEICEVPEGFEVRTELELDRLQGPRTPIETVLRNLVANAVKHHDQTHGVITVGSRPDGSYCLLSVADDGPGIPERARARVFKLFQTLTTSERGGTGIGLAISRRLVESHGGRPLDDFGTGYSPLAHLSQLPIGTIKIDARFVRNMLNEEGDAPLVCSIASASAALGKTVVAEGVETEAHLNALIALGCNHGQGLAIAPAMTATDLVNWIHERPMHVYPSAVRLRVPVAGAPDETLPGVPKVS